MKSHDILNFLLTEAKRLGATAADALWVENVSISCGQRLGVSEGLERAESQAVGLRVFVGERLAGVSASDTSKESLSALVERAVAVAKLSPPDPHSLLAPKELLATTLPELDLCDPHEPDMAWMLENTKRLEEAALAVNGVTNSQGAEAGHSRSLFALATSNGFLQSYATTSTSLSVSVTAGEGEDKQNDYDYSSKRHLGDLNNPESIGAKAGELAVAKLYPRKVSTCQVPLVFDPRAGNRLLYYFVNSISGASVARGTTFLKDDLGKPLFCDQIQIIDNPHIIRGIGSRPFDGEGVANRKTYLVKDGTLQTWLLDLRSAKRLGLTTGGHASRGLGSPPSPGTTNLYMENGSISPQALIGDIQNGFYVTETFGQGLNTITGDYSSGASGFWIENGTLTYPVSEVTIAGHMRDMMRHLTPANDLVFRYGSNTPTYRIDGMTLAGT